MDSFEIAVLLSSEYLDKLKCVDKLTFNLSDAVNEDFDMARCQRPVGHLTIAEKNLPDVNTVIKQKPIQQAQIATMKQVGQKRAGSMLPRASPAKKANVKVEPDIAGNTLGAAAVQKQMFASCIFDGQKMFLCALCSYKTKHNSDMHKHVRGKLVRSQIFSSMLGFFGSEKVFDNYQWNSL